MGVRIVQNLSLVPVLHAIVKLKTIRRLKTKANHALIVINFKLGYLNSQAYIKIF